MSTVCSPRSSIRMEALRANEPMLRTASALPSDCDSASPQIFQPARSASSPISTRELHSRRTEATSDTVVTGKTAAMSMEAMIRVLKNRKLAVHGAHVYLLGMPAILSLASAYATDKITRKVFFDTLDLFVQHTRRVYPTHPKAVKSHHLVSLGIPETVIQKFPMVGNGLDIWTVAGLFNGVIDAEDMDLLYGHDAKGLFQQRHFPGTRTVPAPSVFSYRFGWSGEAIVMAPSIWELSHFDEVIPPACAILEKRPGFYLPNWHYGLRLRAAHLKGEQLSVFRFKDAQHMQSVFHDIFHVVNPNYEPGVNARQEWENFHFVEPKIRENKPSASALSRRSCEIPCGLI